MHGFLGKIGEMLGNQPKKPNKTTTNHKPNRGSIRLCHEIERNTLQSEQMQTGCGAHHQPFGEMASTALLWQSPEDGERNWDVKMTRRA